MGPPAYVSEYLLNRQFQADAPMQKLFTDITYLPYGGRILYLSSILDLFNCQIVASTISDKQDTISVLDTLNQLPSYLEAIKAVSIHPKRTKKLSKDKALP